MRYATRRNINSILIWERTGYGQLLFQVLLVKLGAQLVFENVFQHMHKYRLEQAGRRAVFSHIKIPARQDLPHLFNIRAGRSFIEGKVKEKRLKLPDSVRVVGIVSVSESKSSEEEGKLYFTKKGYVEKSAIQLRSNDGREMSIVLSPFMGTTRIYDSLVGLEEDRGGF